VRTHRTPPPLGQRTVRYAGPYPSASSTEEDPEHDSITSNGGDSEDLGDEDEDDEGSETSEGSELEE